MSAPEKVIFLDIDGVLNCATTKPENRVRLDRAMVARLDRILEVTGAAVVVSSTWRASGLAYVTAGLLAFDFHHVDAVVGCTPWDVDGRHVARGWEIAAWLAEHPGVSRFVILDDDNDMGGLSGHLVQTSYDVGLQDSHVDEVIGRLS